MLFRRKQQALSLVQNLKIIQTLQKTGHRLETLLAQDKYSEAIKLLLGRYLYEIDSAWLLQTNLFLLSCLKIGFLYKYFKNLNKKPRIFYDILHRLFIYFFMGISTNPFEQYSFL